MVRNISLARSQQKKNLIRMLLVSQYNGPAGQLSSPLAALDGFELIGETSTCQEAHRRCRRVQPDLILVDLRAPQSDDLAPLSSLHDEWPEVRLVVLASLPASPDLQTLHEAGVVRCLFEDHTTRKLAGLIHNRAWDHPCPSSKNGSRRPLQAHPQRGLSSREKQVLGWMITGQSSAQIAGRLGVNELTARFHVQNVLSKLRTVSCLEKVSDMRRQAEPGPSIRKARPRLAYDPQQLVAKTAMAAI